MAALVGTPSNAFANSKASQSFLFFSGVDVSTISAFSWGGVDVPVFHPPNVSGPLIRAMGGRGSYDYGKDGAPDGEVVGDVIMGELLAGWRHIGNAACIIVLGGFAVEDHELDTPDPENEVQGTETGVKIVAEIFWRPAEQWQVEASAAYADTFDFWRVRLAGGRRAWRNIVFGAEAEAFGNTSSDQVRFGVFASDIRWRRYNFTLTAGALHDGEGETGAYGRLGMEKKF